MEWLSLAEHLQYRRNGKISKLQCITKGNCVRAL